MYVRSRTFAARSTGRAESQAGLDLLLNLQAQNHPLAADSSTISCSLSPSLRGNTYMRNSRSGEEKHAEQHKRQVPRVVCVRGRRDRGGDDARWRERLFRVRPRNEQQGRRDGNNGLHICKDATVLVSFEARKLLSRWQFQVSELLKARPFFGAEDASGWGAVVESANVTHQPCGLIAQDVSVVAVQGHLQRHQ